MANINIMIVDDQQLVRLGLARLLGDLPGVTVVAQAESGEQTLDILQQLARQKSSRQQSSRPQSSRQQCTRQQCPPDVVLMDVRMPGMGGLETTRLLRERFPRIHVVGLATCLDHPFPQRFLESGATALVTKDAGLEEVAMAIKAAWAGKRYLSQQVAQDMALRALQGKNNKKSLLSPFELLSNRELQIAMLITGGSKAHEMAAQLALSPKSVHTYRYRLFEKLHIRSDVELAMLASRHGLIDRFNGAP